MRRMWSVRVRVRVGVRVGVRVRVGPGVPVAPTMRRMWSGMGAKSMRLRTVAPSGRETTCARIGRGLQGDRVRLRVRLLTGRHGRSPLIGRMPTRRAVGP
eukprot:3957185-Prymnesium_polylepis.2